MPCFLMAAISGTQATHSGFIDRRGMGDGRGRCWSTALGRRPSIVAKVARASHTAGTTRSTLRLRRHRQSQSDLSGLRCGYVRNWWPTYSREWRLAARRTVRHRWNDRPRCLLSRGGGRRVPLERFEFYARRLSRTPGRESNIHLHEALEWRILPIRRRLRGSSEPYYWNLHSPRIGAASLRKAGVFGRGRLDQ